MVPALFEIGYTLVTVFLLSFFLHFSLKSDWGRGSQVKWWVLFGSIFNLYSLSWLYTVYPLVWMPPGFAQLFGIGLLHVVISLSSGACFFVVGYAVTQKTKIWIMPFLIAMSFVVAEILRSYVISVLYLGNNTTIDLHFNAGTIGNALSTTPLVELAYFGGTFALTFCLTYILLVLIIFPLKKATNHIGAIVLILFLTHFLLPTNTPEKELLLGVITTDIRTPNDKELGQQFIKNNQTVTSLVLSDTTKKDILVFPEDARFLSSLGTSSRVALQAKHKDTLIVDGDTLSKDGTLINLSIFYTTTNENLVGRGKELLLPFNEYVPYIFRIVFRTLIGNNLDEYAKLHTYTPMYSDKTFLFNNIKIGTLICSEILSFRVITSLREEHPVLVLYQSRLNVFNNNPWFLMHLRSFSKITAAQLRTTIVSSNNYAPSYIITPNGKIVGEIPVSTSYNTVYINSAGKVILKND